MSTIGTSRVSVLRLASIILTGAFPLAACQIATSDEASAAPSAGAEPTPTPTTKTMCEAIATGGEAMDALETQLREPCPEETS